MTVLARHDIFCASTNEPNGFRYRTRQEQTERNRKNGKQNIDQRDKESQITAQLLGPFNIIRLRSKFGAVKSLYAAPGTLQILSSLIEFINILHFFLEIFRFQSLIAHCDRSSADIFYPGKK